MLQMIFTKSWLQVQVTYLHSSVVKLSLMLLSDPWWLMVIWASDLQEQTTKTNLKKRKSLTKPSYASQSFKPQLTLVRPRTSHSCPATLVLPRSTESLCCHLHFPPKNNRDAVTCWQVRKVRWLPLQTERQQGSKEARQQGSEAARRRGS